ncbi:hypothetical protein KKF70_03355 [bacterium]|nr:hypothetical protein [Candidatus Omnitrophota bacterium]MBU2528407.1 hypothetical protein [bacterium]MBU3930665.1 hypothetical protein [bacterium]MBU4123435.1 hypothetical protein [bacterium]
MMIIGIATLFVAVLAIVVAISLSADGRQFCKNAYTWIVSAICKLKLNKPLVVIYTGCPITNSCSICSAETSKVVNTVDGKQINVCDKCFQKQIQKRIWKEKKDYIAKTL